ncbi:MAG: hypothetical protein L3J83_06510 [Proteobacteria bacterium]|nr:hypothetical protein [Pseudomonadota bacterium]
MLVNKIKCALFISFIAAISQANAFDCESQVPGDWTNANTWINCNNSIPQPTADVHILPFAPQISTRLDPASNRGSAFNGTFNIADGQTLKGDSNDVILKVLGLTIIYVDENVVAAGNGSSWINAFDNLQDALAVAISGEEIWVAQGVYYPDVGGSQMDNDRLATFTLIDGVSIYGGFNGTETDRNQRDPETNTTVLSGDIDGDDTNGDGNNIAESTDDIINNNSYNILIGSNVDTNTMLDGFTITAGKATSADPVNSKGAGIYCGTNTSGPSLNQMIFIANLADDRGAATFGCSQYVTNSSFINQYSDDLAGAVFATGGYYENIIFEGNEARRTGGAMRNAANPLTMKNIKFIANKSRNADGGGLYSSADVTLENILFSGNHAGSNSDDEGGGLYLLNSLVANLTNVTFTGNKAADLGGAISMTNTATLNIQNSIIWNNQDSTASTPSSSININGGTYTQTNSLVQYFGTTGTGNLDEDPLFIMDTDPLAAPTSMGNARLMNISIAIDAGDNSFVTTGTDLDGRARIFNTTVDMGAYEFFEEQVFSDGFE